MKKIAVALILLFVFQAQASIESIFAPIPVQDSGRIKPFDTFARESLQLIYGKKEFHGQAATEIVFTWMLMQHHWDNIEFVQIDNKELKQALGLDLAKKYFSPNEILKSEHLDSVIQALKDKRENKEKLNVYFQAVQRLENQVTTYKAIGQGYIPGWIPPQDGDTWIPLKDFPAEYTTIFLKITKGFAQALKDPSKESDLQAQVQLFMEKSKGDHLDKYPDQGKIRMEVLYNKIQPFQWAWILYFMASTLFLFHFISKKKLFWNLSVLSTGLAFLLHSYGFILRMVIAGRPPVSNMFETVIWVPWGAVLFSFALYKVSKNKFFLFASSTLSFFCLILADMAPVILDSSIQPLQPVLRSNLWLTVHVLTITLSYGAFFLSFVLSDVAMSFYLINEKKYAATLSSLRDSIYRAIQVGVVLLGSGIILGGVWADYSWGRFWGWDPKETWALIAFLGYIAILHGRMSGWIKPFGFVLWTMLAFNLVVMAWYGVNFVLGAGLHSYGFGGGGVPFVATMTGLHFLFATIVWYVRLVRAK